MSGWREILRLALRSDFLFAPTRIYIEIVHYVKIYPSGTSEFIYFWSQLRSYLEVKPLEIPSRRFFFAFTGALELIPSGASFDIRWNFPLGTSELIPFGARLDTLWDFQSPY